MKAPSRVWWVYLTCVMLLALALAWVSIDLLRLERAEKRAHAEADDEASLRLALWRVDSWMSTFLAREAARPAEQYQALFELPQAYSAGFERVETGQVLVRSPLQSVTSSMFPLHFLLRPNEQLTSPQVADGDLPPGIGPEFAGDPERREILGRLRASMDYERLDRQVAAIETRMERRLSELAVDPRQAGLADHRSHLEQLRLSRLDFEKRAGCVILANNADISSTTTLDESRDREPAGPLLPLWLDAPLAPADGQLLFVRRAKLDGSPVLQGFVGNWNRLSLRLLQETDDLFPGARLQPLIDGDVSAADVAPRLATLPASLVPPAARQTTTVAWTRARSTVAVIWLAAAIAALAVGLTLSKSLDLAHRRQRFVSTVTHELRTPLTTFQLYSEMLADGIVHDEEQRRTYLRTLHEESGRLSSMVENVLAYSRLEEGRVPRASERLTVDELLGRVTPPLDRRAQAAGMTLQVREDSSGDSSLEVNVEAVGQILFNLVDNAAKYAKGAAEATIHLEVARSNGVIRLRVRDHGPGIPPGAATAIFEPFERGARDPADPVPGVGLGLELSRGLARHLGGDLTLESAGGPGACFRVELPVAG